jgi:hypothetical protein
LKRAVRTPPMCRYPVGEGAKRTRGGGEEAIVARRLADEALCR